VKEKKKGRNFWQGERRIEGDGTMGILGKKSSAREKEQDDPSL